MKSQKFLTNQTYGLILEILGLSDQPLSVGEIINRIEGRNDDDNSQNWLKNRPTYKYVYRMIEELLPVRDNPVLLFRLDGLFYNQENKDKDTNRDVYVSRAINKLNYIFCLGWPLSGRNYSDIEFISSNIEFYSDGHNNYFIYNNSENNRKYVRINLNPNNKTATLHLFESQNGGRGKEGDSIQPRRRSYSYPLIVRRKIVSTGKKKKKSKDRIYLYISMHNNQTPMRHLYASEKNDTTKDIIRKGKEIIDSQKKIRGQSNGLPRTSVYPLGYDVSLWDDNATERSNWKYRLNVRGLLLYVLTQVESQKKNSSRIYDVRLSNILKNLSENYVRDFPFLMFYHEDNFRNGFESLAEHKLDWPPKNFHLFLLKNIAQELRYVILETSIHVLVYRVAMRFYDSIDPYFRERIDSSQGELRPWSLILPYVENTDFYKRVILYLYKMGEYLRDEQEKELFKIMDNLDSYRKMTN